MHVIEELARFVANEPAGFCRTATRRTCALLLTDLIGAASAGVNSTLATAAYSAASKAYGPGDASVWLRARGLSVAGAASANAAAASALDIDDGHRGAAGHPGAGIISAVLALAQSLKSPDESIFDSIVLGYDVALRIAAARPLPTVDSWASGRWVNYGVAAAAGRLLGLPAPAIAHAMAIAGAEGPIGYRAGTSKYQGSTVKEQIPPAVVAGLTAAFRAEAGATGPLDLLDDEARFTREVMFGAMGDRWWVEDCYLKPYACCRYMHAAVDAIVAMRRHDRPVVSLRIETFPRGLGLANERTPRTLEGAQYSYYFNCALAALRGEEALQPVDPSSLADPWVLELANRIELEAHQDFAGAFPKSTPCRVLLDQGDGIQTMTVLSPLGDVANPMSADQVRSKFLRVSAANVEPAWQAQLLQALGDLPLVGFQPLFEALGQSPKT